MHFITLSLGISLVALANAAAVPKSVSFVASSTVHNNIDAVVKHVQNSVKKPNSDYITAKFPPELGSKEVVNVFTDIEVNSSIPKLI
jgi:hypothetical protein